MRDGTLADLQNELGSFAQGVALSFNAQHNANSAYPPPTTLDGRDTGLLAGDALNFTGKTTIAVTDANGNLGFAASRSISAPARCRSTAARRPASAPRSADSRPR